jgi:hypothetical protein
MFIWLLPLLKQLAWLAPHHLQSTSGNPSRRLAGGPRREGGRGRSDSVDSNIRLGRRTRSLVAHEHPPGRRHRHPVERPRPSRNARPRRRQPASLSQIETCWRRREVADCHLDRLASRLGPQAGNHRPRQVDRVNHHAAAGQRHCDASSPDAQLQGPAAAGQPRQNLDHRVYDARLEQSE